MQSGALIEIDPEADRIELLAETFEHYIDAVLFAIENGSLSFGPGGDFEVDCKEWNKITESHRIKSAWL